ncbi:hypothetical protein BpHYR1_042375 [Brachionus plicatilis]|uniref:Uncharacterized protein n=1 Tax=Brachionus plicatilis TaxID=10195 RepID=A0A3M7Q5U7_BRAPC|nr:hypothetical protein BpHYR1_042375 [Brachionus plicatilis]
MPKILIFELKEIFQNFEEFNGLCLKSIKFTTLGLNWLVVQYIAIVQTKECTYGFCETQKKIFKTEKNFFGRCVLLITKNIFNNFI